MNMALYAFAASGVVLGVLYIWMGFKDDPSIPMGHVDRVYHLGIGLAACCAALGVAIGGYAVEAHTAAALSFAFAVVSIGALMMGMTYCACGALRIWYEIPGVVGKVKDFVIAAAAFIASAAVYAFGLSASTIIINSIIRG